MVQNLVTDFLFPMHSIDPECVNITILQTQMQADFSFRMRPCHKTKTFLLQPCYVLGLLFAFFILSVIVKRFEAIVKICEINVCDETHKFVMLTIRLRFSGTGVEKIRTREDSAQPENCVAYLFDCHKDCSAHE